ARSIWRYPDKRGRASRQACPGGDEARRSLMQFGGILMHLSALPVGRVSALLAGVTAALFLVMKPGADQHAGQAPAQAERSMAPTAAPALAPAAQPPRGRVKDIRLLSQHFNEPGADIAPWMFVPRENIKELSTSEHPGLVTLWEAGKGRDIKGILKDPIRIDDYPLPWQFQLGMIPSFNAQVWSGGKPQANYALGLNVAFPFPAPSPCPKARTRRPPDTHDFQLLVVHLGVTGEGESACHSTSATLTPPATPTGSGAEATWTTRPPA